MKLFKHNEETHICRLDAYVAGGSPEDCDRGIYQCSCGIRFSEMSEYKENTLDAVYNEYEASSL